MAVVAGLLVSTSALADQLPYHVPVQLPRQVTSPQVDTSAPYTPLVLLLLHQLEPEQPHPETDAYPAEQTTLAQLGNAALLLHGTSPTRCTTLGSNAAPVGTTPAIAPLCWADALGVNVRTGAQVRQTTAPPLREGMAASWDTSLLNAWGHVEGAEGRWLGVTGLYGPQADVMRIPNWGRNLTILGEDPFQSGTLAAAEVNGIQGAGLMSQIKHFAMYNGQLLANDTEVQDQALHQTYLQPYEYGTSGSEALPHPGEASSMMCSYQRFRVLPAPELSGGVPPALAPAAGALACDNYLKNLVAHQMWGWTGFFASDYHTAMDSTILAIDSGTDQEMPSATFFGASLVSAVQAHLVTLSAFNLALARILYQEQRFHLLGHADANSNYLSPSNPVDINGQWPLTAAQKAHDGAIAERAAEEGAVLLKNAHRTLPVTRRDLRRGVLVLGESAEYMPPDVGPEQANGYYNRDAVSPLEQLRRFAPPGSHITFMPYRPGGTPTIGDGTAVPKSALSNDGAKTGTGLKRINGPGSPRIDGNVDFTKLSRTGQLRPGTGYAWSGYIRVAAADDYTFHLEFSIPDLAGTPPAANGYLGTPVGGPACAGAGRPTFALATTAGIRAGVKREFLARAGVTLGGIQTDPTQSGYTERGLASCVVEAGRLTRGMHRIEIKWRTPASLRSDIDSLREPGSRLPSLRFAFARTTGDAAAMASAVRHAAKVVVFADCACATETSQTSPNVKQLDANTTRLIQRVATVNPNVAVVLNVGAARSRGHHPVVSVRMGDVVHLLPILGVDRATIRRRFQRQFRRAECRQPGGRRDRPGVSRAGAERADRRAASDPLPGGL